jgi:hypothetical protein
MVDSSDRSMRPEIRISASARITGTSEKSLQRT